MENSQSQENYVVEDVLAQDEKKEEYLIKWKGYRVAESTWMPSADYPDASTIWNAKTDRFAEVQEQALI